jgi:hypothetical protein
MVPDYDQRPKAKPAEQRPADVLDTITEHLSAYGEGGRRMPEPMPLVPREAAQWFIRLMGDPYSHERPRRAPLAGSQGHRWILPYHERLLAALRVFLTLTTKERQFVVEATEYGCRWRGEPIDMYRLVCEETIKYRGISSEEQRKYCKEKVVAVKRIKKEKSI